MPTPTRQCLRCWTPLDLPRAPRVVCPECGGVQPHLSTDLGEFFDCLECGEPLVASGHDGQNELTCQACGALRTFIRGPMVVVTGAPGVGKSALGIQLVARLEDGVVLEPPENLLTNRDSLSIMTMFKDWLVLGVQISQSSRFLVIPGFARPDELDLLPERPWLGTIHWLALVCDPEVLAQRLRSRRKSRLAGDDEIRGLILVNEEIRSLADTDARVTMLDTTATPLEEVAEKAAALIGAWTGR